MAAATAAVVAGLAGCGGSLAPSQARYVGRWDGSVRFHGNRGIEDQGRLRIRVSNSGTFTGTYERFDTGEVTDVTGTVFGGGSFRMRWIFDGYSSSREASGPVKRVRNQLSPDTENGRLPTTNNAGSVGSGLEFLLEYQGG